MEQLKEVRLISIAKKYEIPIHFVGLGEKIEDLQEFTAKDFASSMLGHRGIKKL